MATTDDLFIEAQKQTALLKDIKKLLQIPYKPDKQTELELSKLRNEAE